MRSGVTEGTDLLLTVPCMCRSFRKSSEALLHCALAYRASTSKPLPGRMRGSSISFTTNCMSGRYRANLRRNTTVFSNAQQ